MPQTSLGFTYPDSSGHTRLWEWIQTLAEDIDEYLVGWKSVSGRVKDATGGTIATTEAVEKTVDLTIPASWLTYDVDVFVSVRCLETGVASGNTSITLRVRKTDTAGAEWGSMLHLVGDGSTVIDNVGPATFAAYAEGESATGVITVALTMVASANNGLISWDDLVMIALATRKT
jgi:hypothetical protein